MKNGDKGKMTQSIVKCIYLTLSIYDISNILHYVQDPEEVQDVQGQKVINK